MKNHANLKKYSTKELKTIIANHQHWLKEDCEGWENMKADLSDANLRAANLRAANLRAANLHAANLSDANLHAADLSAADLRAANLHDADLSAADLRDAKGITMACPSDGAFIGWKKAFCKNGIAIVKLQIPEDAKRSSATGRKCRCDKALVLAIYDEGGNEVYQARSWWNNDFIYRVGETVTPNSFDDNRWNECSGGIHFFITRQEAEDYDL